MREHGSGAGVPSRDDPPPRQPVFNALPGSVLVLGALMVAAWGAGAFSEDIRYALLEHGALVTGQPRIEQPWGSYAPWVLHALVHEHGWHLALNVGALLGFGSAAARGFGRGVRAEAGFLAFFFTCAIAGAGAETLVHMTAPEIRVGVGASGAISGCLAAAGWAQGGLRGMRRLALPWAGFNVLLIFVGGLLPIGIGWAAHLGGLAAGMALYPAFVAVFAQNKRS